MPLNELLYLQAALVGLALIWHFSIAHPVIGAYSVAPWILKLGYLYIGKQSPSRWVMGCITLISIAMILVFYGGWNGQTAGISFIALLASLKFLEARTLRDYYMVCIILYFLA
ncbi:MAG: transglutaminaseTgpA domain-containing protein, partial [Pseudomonadota bacterium]